MTTYRIKRLRFLPVLVLFLLLGCAVVTGVPSPSLPTQGSQPPAATTNSSAATAASSAAPQSTDAKVTLHIDFGPGPFNLPDPTVGLSSLSSYTATLKLAFDGTNNGQAEKWSRTYVMRASKTPAARLLTIQTTGPVSNTDPVLLAEMDGVDYQQQGQDLCSASFITPGNTLSDQLEPARYLSFLFGADAAASETVNAVPAKAYTFDERAMAQENLTKSTGKVWVASPGDYVVRYMLTTKGTSDYFGPGVAGTLTEDYELTDIGKPVNLQLPDGCPGGTVSLPSLPDAQNVVDNPGSLSYDTATSLADAAAYYQKQVSGLGWTPISDPDITPTNDFFEYAQGDQTMNITISTAAAGSTVDIFIFRGQPEPAALPPSSSGTPVPNMTIPPIPSLSGTPMPNMTFPPIPSLSGTPIPNMTFPPIPSLSVTLPPFLLSQIPPFPKATP
jgi:hypothetical protein